MTSDDAEGPAWSTAMKHEAMKTWMLHKYGDSRQVTLQTA